MQDWMYILTSVEPGDIFGNTIRMNRRGFL
jgi:hypothetical protein